MSVKDAGKTIREARLKAGMTQEQLSSNICSALSLSRIENGSAGVSPSTFRALMAHAGVPCETFPIFENWNDYECFFHLRHARFYLDAWQLEPAFAELEQVEKRNWNNNKFYYQEWLLLHGILQFRSGCCDHTRLYDFFLKALQISRPTIDLADFKNQLLSITEMELLIFLAQEALYNSRLDEAASICAQVHTYLLKRQLTSLERNQLLAEHAIVYGKYLIATHDYDAAFLLLDTNRHQMVADVNYAPLFELAFLTGLASFSLCQQADAWQHFKSAFYSAHAVGSCYATTCRNYIRNHLATDIPENLLLLPDVPLRHFPLKRIQNADSFSDGVFDCYQKGVVMIGDLIHRLRTEQKISQRVLCQGLCSPSFLSKIESGALQPDIILAETLLQRLGLSDREFAFCGNAHEARLHHFKISLIRYHYLPDENSASMLQEMKQLLTEEDSVLYRQFCFYMEARHAKPAEERITLFQKALACTLPDFSIDKITEYRLSWMELTLLNNIAWTYIDTDTPYQSLVYLRRILDYHSAAKTDIILQKQTLSITLIRLYRTLYCHKYFKEMVDLPELENFSILKYAAGQLGAFHFYLCQAFAECKQYERISNSALYACGLEILREFSNNKTLLLKYLWEDFSISVHY